MKITIAYISEEQEEGAADYRKSSDKIGRFVDEEMEPEPLSETRTGEIYPRYKAWCERNGFFPENAANFKSSLSNIAGLSFKGIERAGAGFYSGKNFL